MKAHEVAGKVVSGAASRPEPSDGLAVRALRGGSWFGTVLAALLVPKCPLCVAAGLSFLGMNAVAASFAAPLLKPLSLLVSVAFLSLILRAEYRAAKLRRARRGPSSTRPHSCCH